MPIALELSGQRFTKLTVLRRVGSANGKSLWLCRCDCGTEKEIRAGTLMNGYAKSCGCLKSAVTTARNLTHGKTKTRAFGIWMKMKARCENPNEPGFRNYGGRGIKVCERWRTFENFLNDMGSPPDGLSLDRFPNNDGNYEPSNCRWATRAEQASNTRRNVIITTTDGRFTMKAFSQRYGLKYKDVGWRVRRGDRRFGDVLIRVDDRDQFQGDQV